MKEFLVRTVGPNAPRANRVALVVGVVLGQVALFLAAFIRSPFVTLTLLWVVVALVGVITMLRWFLAGLGGYLAKEGGVK